MAATPELTVIVPTRNRRAILLDTLQGLNAQEGDFETIVVDDGSSDGSLEAVASAAGTLKFPLRTIQQGHKGPAAARNRGLEAARAAVCLFLGDDMKPEGDLIGRHLRFHRSNPAVKDALLGRVEWSREMPPTPFMHWLESSGIQFGFDQLEGRLRDGRLPGRYFFTSNVSAKTELLRRNGGFDESFPAAAAEDVELGMRLEADRVRLHYDPAAQVWHFHPTDLEGALRRMRRVGASRRHLAARHPAAEVPARPGMRHRLGAIALTIAAFTPGLRSRTREETWRFLCHEAHREGYWEMTPSGRALLRIGERLARTAMRDPDTRLPGAEAR